jgi:hypothetical protein
MSAGSAFAVILIGVGGVLVLVGCRRRSLHSVKDIPESQSELNMNGSIDSQVSPDVADPFLSEENVLSADARGLNEAGLNDDSVKLILANSSSE